MRSRSAMGLLFEKELRELVASRSLWLLLLAVAALVGHAFTTSVALYAEASGAGGGAAALSQGLNPLDGIVVPTLGAYELAAMLLFPFVVIRVFAAERESGAESLVLQFPPIFAASVAAKALALLLAWCVAGVGGAFTLAIWKGMGGHLFAAEVLNVAFGHLLRGLLTIALGAVAAAIATSASSAAIVVLSLTIGTWAIDYVAAARGGATAELARFTPAAALRVFERGELRLDTIVALLVLCVAGLMIVVLLAHQGRSALRRARDVAIVSVCAIVAALGASRFRASADVSEDRRNSFSAVDEAAIRSISAAGPIGIEVNLAASDPRLADYEHGVLSKLRRVASVNVEYVAKGRTGLFEGPRDHYGEIWYQVGGKRGTSRSVSEPIVLETIYALAGRAPPPSSNEAAYPGYPLAAPLSRGGFTMLFVWPVVLIAAWWWTRRPPVSEPQGG